MKYDRFIGDFYDDNAYKLQTLAEADGRIVNLIFDNSSIQYDMANKKRVDVYLDYVMYKIYKIEETDQ